MRVSGQHTGNNAGFSTLLSEEPGNQAEIETNRPRKGGYRPGAGRKKALDRSLPPVSLSHDARRLHEVLGDLVAHLAGEPTAAELLICRRAARIAVWCEATEAQMAEGRGVDIGEYLTASNSLRRLLETIGLQRRARNVSLSLRDQLLEGHAA
jgi:hypothetical protein